MIERAAIFTTEHEVVAIGKYGVLPMPRENGNQRFREIDPPEAGFVLGVVSTPRENAWSTVSIGGPVSELINEDREGR